MTKAELIKKVAGGTGVSQAGVERVLNKALEVMKGEIKGGGRINLGGFGIFSVATRATRTIQTRLLGNGQVADQAVPKVIPARRVVKFKPALHFKEAVEGV